MLRRVVSRYSSRGTGRTNLNESSNFLVLRDDGSTRDAGETNLAGVTLERSVDEGSSHTVDISLRFRIGKGLIGSRLLQTNNAESARRRCIKGLRGSPSDVLDVSSSSSSGGGSKQTEDGVVDSVGIVLLQ